MDNFSTMLGDDLELQMNAIRDMVEARLKHLLNSKAIPDSMRYIVDEVSIARFNQIGSEGLSTHIVEGETQAWEEDLFAPYMDDINAYLRRNGGLSRIRFW
jgi:hypothetical protein